MNLRPPLHGLGLSGPLDTFVELGIPLLLFVVLWWWSSRGQRRARDAARRSREHERPSGDDAAPRSDQ